MKTSIQLHLEITFTDEVKKADYKEIMNNVMESLIHAVESGPGLSPEMATYITEHIRINDRFQENGLLTHSF